jgi:CBS domain-containing protein
VELPTLRSILEKRPPTLYSVDVSARVPDALKMLLEQDVGAILVLDAGRVVGIFSERDYVRNSSAPATIRVGDVMSSCVTSGALTDSAHAWSRRMIEEHLRYLPILEKGNPIALLAREDLLSAMLAYLERVFKENELDRQIASLQGTYSC